MYKIHILRYPISAMTVNVAAVTILAAANIHLLHAPDMVHGEGIGSISRRLSMFLRVSRCFVHRSGKHYREYSSNTVQKQTSKNLLFSTGIIKMHPFTLYSEKCPCADTPTMQTHPKNTNSDRICSIITVRVLILVQKWVKY